MEGKLDDAVKANDKLQEQLANTTKKLSEDNAEIQNQNKVLNDKLDAILKELADSKPVDTIVTVVKPADAKFGQNVTISGKLTDKAGNAVAGSTVVVSVNGNDVKAVTGEDGAYTLVVRASSTGSNDVTVSFAANNKYNGAENSTVFSVVKQNLKLTLDKVKAAVYGDKITVTGVLGDANGKLLANTL